MGKTKQVHNPPLLPPDTYMSNGSVISGCAI